MNQLTSLVLQACLLVMLIGGLLGVSAINPYHPDRPINHKLFWACFTCVLISGGVFWLVIKTLG